MLKSFTFETTRYPLARAFGISRGSKTVAETVIVSVQFGDKIGRGECVPYGRYGESVAAVLDQLERLKPSLSKGASRSELYRLLPAGAARNAVDCALWDLELKQKGKSIFEAFGVSSDPILTAFTIPYADAATMRENALKNANRPILKIKLGSPDDTERLVAVADAAPNAQLVVDANEGWSFDEFEKVVPLFEANGVVMVEQPLPAGKDKKLRCGTYPFLLCADESCHDRHTLSDVLGHYDMINIKLDKTGGLTEAMRLKSAAIAEGLQVMVGCMVASSLSIAPAFIVAQGANIVDLDGPLLLKKDIRDGMAFSGSWMSPPVRNLWG